MPAPGTSAPAGRRSGSRATRRAEPNYITRKKVRGRVLLLEGAAQPNFSRAIVLTPNADPGYDWIFSRGIAGLITTYGGVNSHMAVRAAEFGLPSAIGVGELLFTAASRARMIDLDCSSRQIHLLD